MRTINNVITGRWHSTPESEGQRIWIDIAMSPGHTTVVVSLDETFPWYYRLRAIFTETLTSPLIARWVAAGPDGTFDVRADLAERIVREQNSKWFTDDDARCLSIVLDAIEGDLIAHIFNNINNEE